MSLKRKAATTPTNDAKKPKANGSITSFFGPPKVVSSTAKASGTGTDANEPAPVTSRFDKEKWVASLTDEQKELLTLEIETLHDSWLAVLKEEILSKDFLELKKFLNKEWEGSVKIFPPKEDIYSWSVNTRSKITSILTNSYTNHGLPHRSRHTPLNTVKAVILGQDPYHNFNQAHGLCFSVRPPTPAPPSLKNIFKALSNDYPDFVPPPKNGGLLTPWADRGVLMLNTCLTVRAHQANSHSNHGWEKFTQKVIDTVAKQRTRGVVFLAWGSPAAKRVAKVDRKRHCVLLSVHPSPLSASRGWFECGHFKKTNEWLKERHGEHAEIDWSLGVPPEEAGV
ncbi:uracil DNA glycosylase [Clarireedia jacksonii]